MHIWIFLGTWVLRGTSTVGDSIADEWLIVWLLVTLSKEFPKAWLGVRDADGEFLAVEAAEHVPDWLTPDNDSNRVSEHWSSLDVFSEVLLTTDSFYAHRFGSIKAVFTSFLHSHSQFRNILACRKSFLQNRL